MRLKHPAIMFNKQFYDFICPGSDKYRLLKET